MVLSPAPTPTPLHRMYTADGLYSLICLSAVQPTATEPKCSTFWKPSTSWSSGPFMLTSSWAHLPEAELGESLGEKLTRAFVAPAEQPPKEGR